MPRSREEELQAITGFYNIAQFPQVLGAIDGTHIPVSNPGGPLAQLYINRKGWYSLNVQMVVNHPGKIMDVVARWRGSVHDSRIFNESVIKQRLERNEFRGLLVGDSGYACTKYMLTPLLHPTNDREERYNRAHILTRGVVERSLGRMKQTFRCLLTGITPQLETAKAIIVACSALHNLIVEWHGNEDINDYEDEQPNLRIAHQNNAGNVFRQQFIQNYF